LKITKITASKKDDILKRKAQYDADKAAYDARYKEHQSALREAERKVLDPIQKFLESQLRQFDALDFDIDVRRGYNWGKGDKEYEFAEVYIRCNEHSKFEDSSALSWSYDIGLDSNGEVTRKSSSWSGLKATTVDQMKSLRQTVDALEFLNEVNWNTIIKVDMPKYSDYKLDEAAPKGEDWRAQLQEAELEELIGTRNIIKIYNWNTSPVSGKFAYIQVLKETPAQYLVKVIDSWTIDYVINGDETGVTMLKNRLKDTWNVVRAKKGNISLADPATIYNLDDLLNSEAEV